MALALRRSRAMDLTPYQKQIIGDNVFHLRKERGEGTKRLASYLGFEFAAMTTELERGRFITEETLYKLAEYFDVSVVSLVTASDEMQRRHAEEEEKARRKEEWRQGKPQREEARRLRIKERQQKREQDMPQLKEARLHYQREHARIAREEKRKQRREERLRRFEKIAKGKELLTTRETARILCVDPSTIIQWIQRGSLEAMRLPGKIRHQYRIQRSVLEALL